MRLKQRSLFRANLRHRRGEGFRLAAAIGGLIASLVAVYFTAGYVKTSATSAASKAALAVQMEQKAMAKMHLDRQKYRAGSIVTSYPGEPCTELRFDNLTGAFISVANVNCDVRLENPDVAAATESQENNVANMRGVLASFKR